MDYSALYHYISTAHARLLYRWGAGFALPPMHVYIETTYRCNLRCVMCPYRELGTASALAMEELSTAEIKTVIDQLNWWTLITFTGGEPLLLKDMGEIVAHAGRRHRCHLITNGVLIDNALARLLVSCGPRWVFRPGLLAIMISLEGPEEVHDSIVQQKGAYRKTVDAMILLRRTRDSMKKRYPLLGSTTVITRTNAHHLAGMVDHAEKTGLDICNFTLYNPVRLKAERTENPDVKPKKLDVSATIPEPVLRSQYEEIMQRVRHSRVRVRFAQHGLPFSEVVKYYENRLDLSDYVCRSPWSRSIVTAGGDVIPCFGPALGNIRTQRIPHIWNGAGFRNFRRLLRFNRVFEDCAGCCMLEYEPRKHRFTP